MPHQETALKLSVPPQFGTGKMPRVESNFIVFWKVVFVALKLLVLRQFRPGKKCRVESDFLVLDRKNHPEKLCL